MITSTRAAVAAGSTNRRRGRCASVINRYNSRLAMRSAASTLLPWRKGRMHLSKVLPASSCPRVVCLVDVHHHHQQSPWGQRGASTALPSPPRGPSSFAPVGTSKAAMLATDASAAYAYDEDEDEDEETGGDRCSPDRVDPDSLLLRRQQQQQLRRQRQRPRLDRLRERLHQEEGIGKKPVVLSSWTSKESAANSSSNVSNTRQLQLHELPPADLASLRSWVRALPDINPNVALTDTFQRKHNYLRISLTERCNLRCTYCMPPEGVPLQHKSHLLQTDEILELSQVFSDLGVNKFRLTGGEPTLRSDVVDVVAGIKALNPKLIGMTSNGVKLVKMLPDLVEAGLDSLNISLDTLRPDKFEKMTRRPAANFHRVLQALEMAHDQFAVRTARGAHRPFTVKLNCVVMRGVNDDEVPDFVRLVAKYPALQVRFIEYMPFDANGWKTSLLVPYTELLDRIAQPSPGDTVNHSVPLQLDPVPSDDPHDTTKWYSLRDAAPHVDHHGNPPRLRQVGFITSMSSHFCDSCNRLRLTADGQLKSCLFNGGEVSLRDALRGGGLGTGSNSSEPWSTTELHKLIHYGAVLPKKRALGGHDSPQDIHEDAKRNRPMTLIGG